jgi:hypothetical protein
MCTGDRKAAVKATHQLGPCQLRVTNDRFRVAAPCRLYSRKRHTSGHSEIDASCQKATFSPYGAGYKRRAHTGVIATSEHTDLQWAFHLQTISLTPDQFDGDRRRNPSKEWIARLFWPGVSIRPGTLWFVDRCRPRREEDDYSLTNDIGSAGCPTMPMRWRFRLAQ